jgi:hypothetical protein
MTALRPIVGILIRYAVAWAIGKGLLTFADDAAMQQFIDAVGLAVDVVLGGLLAGSLAKLSYDRKFNPTSAAKPSVVPVTDPGVTASPTIEPSAVMSDAAARTMHQAQDVAKHLRSH